ncbi:MAG: molybdopterin molybdotransferase MoeA [Rhodospirillaceae bacterium]|nr:molybdopterin molybdotransferase MoeA [Rhodospirillaceae bacterium]MBT6609837.1 molybdopterin molybdotransferase MoeA [Rhodospirillaceae bacterium]MBT7508944.1 molybdopterin molybdotransferase MoeA [Rhodospirillaceae bacterium]
MLSVAEALTRVTGGFSLISSEQVALGDGLGRVLAEDVAARLTQPPSAVSAMDGYAVRAADVGSVPVTLKQIGVSQAGQGFPGAVGPGECARIFTGAPLPDGADAIVIQEDTTAVNEQITVMESAQSGADVRPAGLDFSVGDILLKTGAVLSARDLGLAAAMNVPWLRVRRRPRVAIVATGDEVMMPGDPIGADQIVSSNSIALAAIVRVLGGEPLGLGIARDTDASLRQVLSGAKGADVLVTIGGASVGDYDLVQKVMAEDGLDLNFYKVAMRPGKPLIFGRWKDIPVLGLPGNPVSAGVTSAIFLRAAINVMLGIGDGGLGTEKARLGCDVKANGMRQEFMRATLDTDSEGNLVTTPFDRQDSAMMASFASADCLVIRPVDAPSAQAGDIVEIVRFDTGLSRF